MATLTSFASSGLRGDIAAPGDKSISHRALMLSSQVLGVTRIFGLLEGEDVLRTAEALRALGVLVTRKGEGEWEVSGVGIGGLSESASMLEMGNSGTSTRLLMGLLTPYPFTSFFSGDASLSRRPMARVAEPLSQMGAHITARAGCRLPLALTGTQEPLPISYTLPVPSAQVKSAILLAALNTPGETTVVEAEPTRDHTENMLEHFGYRLTRARTEEGHAVTLAGQQELPPAARELRIPADPSSAAFPLVAALITENSEVTVRNVCVNPLRTGLFVTLKEMGASLEYTNERVVAGEKVADIIARSSNLKGVKVPASRAPSMIDEYPILAMACACAQGESVMEGLSELRVKESDRLSAIAAGLMACGVAAHAEQDSLRVTGATEIRGGANVETHFDHRIAMSFLVLGLRARLGVSVADAESINTSFPGFCALMKRLGANLRETGGVAGCLVIAIDGPAASGKGTLARRLAQHFGLHYLDTGSLYRAVGLRLIYTDKDPHDPAAAIEAAQNITAQDLANPRLRQERVGQAASIISAIPEVRDTLLEFQRNFSRTGRGAVLDGRDIGTVVCPDAEFKFFITASMEARARRRHRELSGQGIEVVYESVLEDLRERDERDSKRSVAPLKPAEDAVVIDTSTMDANSVFEKVRQLVGRKIAR